MGGDANGCFSRSCGADATPAISHLGLAQRPEGLDHALQLVLGGAVAAVGVRVAALHQLGVAARGSSAASAVASRSRSARALRSSRPSCLSYGGAARPRPAARRRRCRRRRGRSRCDAARGRLARAAPGLERPGRPPAGGSSSAWRARICVVGHAGEEVPGAIVFGRVRLAEPVVLVRAGRATSAPARCAAGRQPGWSHGRSPGFRP